jgi:hypothetical protein
MLPCDKSEGQATEVVQWQKPFRFSVRARPNVRKKQFKPGSDYDRHLDK